MSDYSLKNPRKDGSGAWTIAPMGGRITQGVDTADYIIADSSTTGLVLKDDANPPHYWRVKVKIPAGTIDLVDLGTTKP